MTNVLKEIVAGWLREEDDVPTVSGTPTKESLKIGHADRNGFETAVKSERYVECLFFFACLHSVARALLIILTYRSFLSDCTFIVLYLWMVNTLNRPDCIHVLLYNFPPQT